LYTHHINNCLILHQILESLGIISANDAASATQNYQSVTEGTPRQNPSGDDEDLSKRSAAEAAIEELACLQQTLVDLSGVGSALEKVGLC
jgi:hypothetical protein